MAIPSSLSNLVCVERQAEIDSVVEEGAGEKKLINENGHSTQF